MKAMFLVDESRGLGRGDRGNGGDRDHTYYGQEARPALMRARPGLLIMVAATVGLSTFAQSNARYPIDVQLELCLQDTAGRSTAGMRQCCYAAMEAWVEEMNKGYQTLLASLKPEGQAALREAQRAWLTYRDKQFELTNEIYMSEMQGTMYHVVATNNNMELVKERALHLKTMLDALNEQR